VRTWSYKYSHNPPFCMWERGHIGIKWRITVFTFFIREDKCTDVMFHIAVRYVLGSSMLGLRVDFMYIQPQWSMWCGEWFKACFFGAIKSMSLSFWIEQTWFSDERLFCYSVWALMVSSVSFALVILSISVMAYCVWMEDRMRLLMAHKLRCCELRWT
jgi:hypothetical protein